MNEPQIGKATTLIAAKGQAARFEGDITAANVRAWWDEHVDTVALATELIAAAREAASATKRRFGFTLDELRLHVNPENRKIVYESDRGADGPSVDTDFTDMVEFTIEQLRKIGTPGQPQRYNDFYTHLRIPVALQRPLSNVAPVKTHVDAETEHLVVANNGCFGCFISFVGISLERLPREGDKLCFIKIDFELQSGRVRDASGRPIPHTKDLFEAGIKDFVRRFENGIRVSGLPNLDTEQLSLVMNA